VLDLAILVVKQFVAQISYMNIVAQISIFVGQLFFSHYIIRPALELCFVYFVQAYRIDDIYM
jgi:hypothetical protein